MNKEKEVNDELVRKMIYLHDKYGLNGATTVNYHLNKSKANQYRKTYDSYIKNGYSITRKAMCTDEEIDEMVKLKTKGESYRSIARKFSISHSTAKSYILRKMNRDKANENK